MYSLVKALKNFVAKLTQEIDHIPDDAILLDIRNPDEYKQGTIEGSLLIPLSKISDNAHIKKQLPDLNRPIVVYCESGGRAIKAKHELKKMGYVEVYNGGGITQIKKIIEK